MKVGVVTPRYPPNITGGGEVSVKLLVDRLDAHPCVSDVSVFSFDTGYPEVVDGVRVRRHNLPTRVMEVSNPVAASKIRDEIGDFDILHGYNMELHPAVGYLSDRLDIPSVATLNSYTFIPWHEYEATPSSIPKRLYERFFLPTTGKFLLREIGKINRLLALSESVEEMYEEKFEADQDLAIVPNMTDPGFEEQLSNASVSNPQNSTRLLFVGSLKREKGVRYLIDALEYLDEEFEVTIVGGGPEENGLKKRARKRGVFDRVSFLGSIPHDQVAEEYLRADIFVHPGVWPEPFGRTILEAMQAGLPVVCSNVGAPPEIVSDERVIADVGDPSSLAQAVNEAVRNEGEIRLQNQKRLDENYSPDEVADRVVQHYRDILEDPASPRPDTNSKLN